MIPMGGLVIGGAGQVTRHVMSLSIIVQEIIAKFCTDSWMENLVVPCVSFTLFL